ncbi:MAG: myo-inositol 2-dehydrogenase/D-chiro-inositol 1-dehydrogenase [Verrucomicrobiales bacterium]|jgi:myo-inositol 2-dehydrogenase/D-chiro-inositol 1-dehydrogenase
MARERKNIGIGVVGVGKIGVQRARLAAQHPSVDYLSVMDIDHALAESVGEQVSADAVANSVDELVNDDRVDAVVISTAEPFHVEPALAALAAGKPILIEKPIAMSLPDADEIVAAVDAAGVDARVGYSMRYLQKYSVAWDNVAQGKVGEVVGITGRVYSTRAQGLAILRRSAAATPVIDIVTYLVDVANWYLAPDVPVEVVSRGHGTVFRENGFDCDDIAFSMVRYSDGTVADLGVCYMLPMGFPTAGQSIRFEVFGTDGALMIDDDHRDQMMYSEHGYQNSYATDQQLNFAFLGSRTTGEWVGDTMFGRLANETRAWLDNLVTGTPCHLTTVEEARRVLAVTVAMEESLRTGNSVEVARLL